MTSGYERITTLTDLFARIGELAVKTVIFDIEPLVAPWNSSQQALDRGLAEVVSQLRTIPSVCAVVFSTNSARRPSAVPASGGLQIEYLASAGKPLRTAPYRDLPRPGAVIGDQLPTDGILAYRLGCTFLHYDPPMTGVPIGPRLMHHWGQLIRPVLFKRPGPGRNGVVDWSSTSAGSSGDPGTGRDRST